MTEPQLDDPIARKKSYYYRLMEVECGDCSHLQEVEVEEEYSHHTITWFAEWTCAKCGLPREQEGWYSDDDI